MGCDNGVSFELGVDEATLKFEAWVCCLLFDKYISLYKYITSYITSIFHQRIGNDKSID